MVLTFPFRLIETQVLDDKGIKVDVVLLMVRTIRLSVKSVERQIIRPFTAIIGKIYSINLKHGISFLGLKEE